MGERIGGTAADLSEGISVTVFESLDQGVVGWAIMKKELCPSEVCAGVSCQGECVNVVYLRPCPAARKAGCTQGLKVDEGLGEGLLRDLITASVLGMCTVRWWLENHVAGKDGVRVPPDLVERQRRELNTLEVLTRRKLINDEDVRAAARSLGWFEDPPAALREAHPTAEL